MAINFINSSNNKDNKQEKLSNIDPFKKPKGNKLLTLLVIICFLGSLFTCLPLAIGLVALFVGLFSSMIALILTILTAGAIWFADGLSGLKAVVTAPFNFLNNISDVTGQFVLWFQTNIIWIVCIAFVFCLLVLIFSINFQKKHKKQEGKIVFSSISLAIVLIAGIIEIIMF